MVGFREIIFMLPLVAQNMTRLLHFHNFTGIGFMFAPSSKHVGFLVVILWCLLSACGIQGDRGHFGVFSVFLSSSLCYSLAFPAMV